MKILEGFIWGVVMLVVLVIGLNAGKTEAKKQADAAYKQGYKDALYKRPVSDDLEMVCAGIWVGRENEKYIAKEMKK